MIERVYENPEVYCIPVELPKNPLQYLNVYVIHANQKWLIVDTGFNRPECRESLYKGLTALGVDLSSTILYLTHFHSDHVGLVWDFVERGVPVYMCDKEYEYYKWFCEVGGQRAIDRVFAQEGYPEKQLMLQEKHNQGRVYAPAPGFPAILISDGDRLPFEGVEIRVLCVPGHTPGNSVLYLPEMELLFCGDHVLFDITPNISAWPKVENSIGDYIASLKKIAGLSVNRAFPAHRASGEDVYTRVEQIIRHHENRLEEIYRVVDEHPGCTAYETASRIKWSRGNRAWEDFSPHNRWFAVGETLAHINNLILQGRLIVKDSEDNRVYYVNRLNRKV